MALAFDQSTRLSYNQLVHAFLVAERDRVLCLPGVTSALLDSPDLSDPAQNHFRLRILYYLRLYLLAEVPPDTEWYRVVGFDRSHLSNLLIIGRCGWDMPTDRNELLTAAPIRKKGPLRTAPSLWGPIILWGHTTAGPFTILEGNNRLSAYVEDGVQEALPESVIVGLSPTYCFWHLPDPVKMLANDMCSPSGAGTSECER
jgi:hypothetical protein